MLELVYVLAELDPPPTPAELADLVEYCWGNASTPMGAKRVADGHAAPYTVKYFELGNEQNTACVRAIRARNSPARNSIRLTRRDPSRRCSSSWWAASSPTT